MPELPEVQTTATSLTPLLNQTVSQVQVFQPKLRFAVPDDLDRLQGLTLVNIERRAKYLLLTFAKSAQTKKLLIHLGMSGSLQQHPQGTPKRKHDHVIIEFGNTQLHYHDPRRFGMVLWLDDYQHKLLDHLGLEPLDAAFDADYLYQKIHQGKNPITRPIKAVIMEQSVVVGVGNIYATESLFLANIHPLTPANLLTHSQLVTLVGFIKKVLQISIEKGGSTLRDFTVADGKMGYFQQTLNVYGKKDQPCPNCGTAIETVKIAQRASTFCPTCQPFVPAAKSVKTAKVAKANQVIELTLDSTNDNDTVENHKRSKKYHR